MSHFGMEDCIAQLRCFMSLRVFGAPIKHHPMSTAGRCCLAVSGPCCVTGMGYLGLPMLDWPSVITDRLEFWFCRRLLLHGGILARL